MPRKRNSQIGLAFRILRIIVGPLLADGCRRFTVDLAMALYCRINGVEASEDVIGNEASPSALLKEVLSGESPAPRTLQAVEQEGTRRKCLSV
jgi:hypothetical protein